MKKWYQSKTIQGILVALIGAVGMYLGRELPADELENVISLCAAAVGAILGIYGRFKANDKVTV